MALPDLTRERALVKHPRHTVRYAAIRCDISDKFGGRIKIPPVGIVDRFTATYSMDIFNIGGEKLLCLKMGMEPPSYSQLSIEEMDMILDAQPEELNNCSFVTQYQIATTGSEPDQKIPLVAGPITWFTKCVGRTDQWAPYTKLSLEKHTVQGKFERGQTKALPYDMSKSGTYAKGTVVTMGGKTFIATCDGAGGMPQADSLMADPEVDDTVDADVVTVVIDDSPADAAPAAPSGE